MKQSFRRKEFRSFKEVDFYSDLVEGDQYTLLPFNFERLPSGREVIITLSGDFQIVPKGTVDAIVHKNCEGLDFELVQDLVAKDVIHESANIKNIEVLANRYRTSKSYVNGFARLHMFVISLRCDHTCQYCQVSRVSENKDKYDLQHDHLIKAIELMLECPDEHLTMEFQGGEALLAFENIKFAIEYTQTRAAELGKKMTYVICTNLSRIDKLVTDYCKENNVLISASLDGPDFVHDTNRKKAGRNSHALTEKGIRLVQEELGKDFISVLMTTSTESLKYPIEIIDEYRRLGFESIFLRPISPYGFAVYNKLSHYLTDDFLTFYKTGLDYILKLNKNGERIRETYTCIILKRMLTSFTDGYVDLMSPSGLVSNAIIYDYDGKVYASDESRMLAQMNDSTFCLGTVDNSWEELLASSSMEIIKENGVNDALAGCESCAFNGYCGSDPVNHHATQGDPYGHRPTSSFCKRNKGVMQHIFQLIDEDPEVLPIFNSWIKNG